MNILVTAGATRNPIDAMRFISARSSGRTGLELLKRWEAAGATVHLLASEEVAARAPDVDAELFGATRDLMARMERWVRRHPDGAVVHAAAVGDYEVPDALEQKIPSGQPELVLRLRPTPKIADHVRAWGLRGPYVTFKAAPPGTDGPALVALARAQMQRTGCDCVFANVLGNLQRDVWLVGTKEARHDRRTQAIDALGRWVLHALSARA